MAAVKSAIVPCPDCDGDGFQVEQTGPGREFGFGYVPTERMVECLTCGGRGTIIDPTLTAPPAGSAMRVKPDTLPVREEPLPF